MFGKKKEEVEPVEQQSQPSAPFIAILGSADPAPLTGKITALGVDVMPNAAASAIRGPHLRAVIAPFLSNSQLEEANAALQPLRAASGANTPEGVGYPVMLIISRPDQITDLGRWLHQTATADQLTGIRLAVANNLEEVAPQLESFLEPAPGSNIIKMPIAPEVENSPLKYFFAMNPSLRAVVRYIRELAENGVSRIYLLGGPGTGKTSLAYYYWLNRAKGRFIAVNLSAESTGDKAAMKSLLCGHVAGSIAGTGAREGALAFAEDGVCFLDESHGVTGVVMQILMECLENNQFLPFGATKKRALDCAVVFASNRSWDTLRAMINLDEHARLGATIVKIPDLAVRLEDTIAVTSTVLSKFAGQCTTWKPPKGIAPDAWELISKCPWRGNTRALIRVLETACVTFCTQRRGKDDLLDFDSIKEGMDLWEPEKHESHQIYTSFQ